MRPGNRFSFFLGAQGHRVALSILLIPEPPILGAWHPVNAFESFAFHPRRFKCSTTLLYRSTPVEHLESNKNHNCSIHHTSRLSAHTNSALDQRQVLQFERVNEEQ